MVIRANDFVLFQGDSITDAGRDRTVADVNDDAGLGNGYARMVAAHLLGSRTGDELKFLNRGVSGNRVTDLRDRWAEECLDLRPDVVSILIGVNDTWHGMTRGAGVSVPEYARVYRELLRDTRAALPEVRLVLCEPFILHCGAVTEEWRPEMARRREIVAALARDFDAVLVPFQAVFDAAVKDSPPEQWAADGVHPTVLGHQLMARTWVRAATGQVDDEAVG